MLKLLRLETTNCSMLVVKWDIFLTKSEVKLGVAVGLFRNYVKYITYFYALSSF